MKFFHSSSYAGAFLVRCVAQMVACVTRNDKASSLDQVGWHSESLSASKTYGGAHGRDRAPATMQMNMPAFFQG